MAYSHISVCGMRKAGVETFEQKSQRSTRLLFWPQQQRREGRTKGQSIEGRDDDRYRDGKRELLIEPAGNAWDKSSRNKYGSQNQSDGDDRTRDFLHRFQRGLLRRESVFDVMLDRLDDNDRVIHDQADR